MTHRFQITGMTCNSCIARVKSELLKLGDIISVEMQLQSPQAIISMNRHITEKELQVAVSKAGSYSIKALDNDETSTSVIQGNIPRSTYLPVYLIFGYIGMVVTLVQFMQSSFSWMQWMTHFMSGFFMVFSFFKLLDLKGFAASYHNYDLIARRFRAWGFIYPFIELGLGIAFLVNGENIITVLISLIMMAIASVGVAESLLKKKNFRCACLGTAIALPLGKVALFEDLLMVIMSAGMLYFIY